MPARLHLLARGSLKELAQALEIPKNHVVLAPGNHDVDRSISSRCADAISDKAAGGQAWLAKFRAYLEFTEHFYDEPEYTPKKPFRIFLIDKRVAIVAFNSCIVEGSDSALCKPCYQKRSMRLRKAHYCGWLDPQDIRDAGAELNSRGWEGPRVAVFHHHIIAEGAQRLRTGPRCQGDHLRNYDTSDDRVKFVLYDFGFRIILHGHRHQSDIRQPSVPGSREPWHCGSGTLWSTDSRIGEAAGFLWLKLAGEVGGSRVSMRRYKPATANRTGYWDKDDTLSADGVITLSDHLLTSRAD